jgi:hypothetical protein
MGSPFDLARLADLKRWLDVAGSDDDEILARLITQMSRAILSTINRPSILPATYVEFHDGGMDESILLRQWPVNEVLSCSVNALAVPAGTSLAPGAVGQGGYVFDAPDLAPPGAMQRLSLRGASFGSGVQNVHVIYKAGYQRTNEPATVPVNTPYMTSVLAPYGAYACDGGVIDLDGGPFELVSEMPGAGQYAVDDGTYAFASADAGREVLITYGYVPADLASCCIEWAAERYAYRSRIGQRSKALGGHETIAFVVKDMPDYVALGLQPYRRVVMP